MAGKSQLHLGHFFFFFFFVCTCFQVEGFSSSKDRTNRRQEKATGDSLPGNSPSPEVPRQSTTSCSIFQAYIYIFFYFSKSLFSWLQYCFWDFFFLGFGFLATKQVGSYLPDQRSNPYFLHWKHKVLTNGLSGKSQAYVLCQGLFFVISGRSKMECVSPIISRIEDYNWFFKK